MPGFGISVHPDMTRFTLLQIEIWDVFTVIYTDKASVTVGYIDSDQPLYGYFQASVSGCYVRSQDLCLFTPHEPQTWQVWVGCLCLAHAADIDSDAISEKTEKDSRHNKSNEGVPRMQDCWSENQESPRQTGAS